MTLFSAANSSQAGPPARSLTEQLQLIGFTLAVLYLMFLVGSAFQGYWLIDPLGRPLANDFVNVFAAGKLTLQGTPAAAYDWTVHKAAEFAAVGHEFDGYYTWPYPPTFLFPAAALALLPFLPAAVARLALTLPLYAATIGTIVGHRCGFFLACGFAGVVWTLA